MSLVVCGVSGSGKTTIGKLLADALGMPFFDADDFHPPSNIEKMASGVPLDDRDRQSWLATLATKLSSWEKNGGAVLACSALKESHRAALGLYCDEQPNWVVLRTSEAVLVDRLASRTGHFFDKDLLKSQLDVLEIPDYGWVIDSQAPPQEIVNDVLTRLRESG